LSKRARAARKERGENVNVFIQEARAAMSRDQTLPNKL
jgi:hypothetical protein